MEKSNFEKEKERKEIALFRYAIIAPLINNMNPFKSKEEFFRDASSKKYTLPNGKEAIIDISTIKKWYMNYNKLGFDCLLPKSRVDEGISRKISINLVNKIVSIKQHFPHITGKAIYKKLIEDGDIDASKVSLSSIYRFLNANNLHIETNHIERKAFEMEFSNDMWQRRYFSWTNHNYRRKKSSDLFDTTN